MRCLPYHDERVDEIINRETKCQVFYEETVKHWLQNNDSEVFIRLDTDKLNTYVHALQEQIVFFKNLQNYIISIDVSALYNKPRWSVASIRPNPFLNSIISIEQGNSELSASEAYRYALAYSHLIRPGYEFTACGIWYKGVGYFQATGTRIIDVWNRVSGWRVESAIFGQTTLYSKLSQAIPNMAYYIEMPSIVALMAIIDRLVMEDATFRAFYSYATLWSTVDDITFTRLVNDPSLTRSLTSIDCGLTNALDCTIRYGKKLVLSQTCVTKR